MKNRIFITILRIILSAIVLQKMYACSMSSGTPRNTIIPKLELNESKDICEITVFKNRIRDHFYEINLEKLIQEKRFPCRLHFSEKYIDVIDVVWISKNNKAMIFKTSNGKHIFVSYFETISNFWNGYAALKRFSGNFPMIKFEKSENPLELAEYLYADLKVGIRKVFDPNRTSEFNKKEHAKFLEFSDKFNLFRSFLFYPENIVELNDNSWSFISVSKRPIHRFVFVKDLQNELIKHNGGDLDLEFLINKFPSLSANPFSENININLKLDNELRRSLVEKRLLKGDFDLYSSKYLNQDDNCYKVLFENYKRSITYFEDVIEQQPCVFKFTNHFFKVEKILGSGFASVIYKTSENKALRVVYGKESIHDMGIYLEIYEDLKKHGVPVVDSSTDSFTTNNVEFIIQDVLKIKQNFSEFKSKYKTHTELLDARSVVDYKALIEFVGKVSDYIFISDVHEKNIVQLDNGQWILMDFGCSKNVPPCRIENKYFHFFNIGDELSEIFSKTKREEIFTYLKNSGHLRDATLNVLTDPDPSIMNFMKVPDEWEDDFRQAILLSRFDKSIK